MIIVQTKIQAPITIIWDLWTKPEHIIQWNAASEDWHTPHAENDLKVGGKCKSTMASKDGAMSFDFVGTYDVILDKKLIAYTIEDGRNVMIVFDELEDGFEVREYFEPESVHSEELQYQGWLSILENFKRYVENNRS